MKRRILLLTLPALLSSAYFLFLKTPAPSSLEITKTDGGTRVEFRPSANPEGRLKALAEADYMEQELPAGYEEAGFEGKLVRARTVVPRNDSGVSLENLPAGISRVNAVLFENEVAEAGGIRRSRILDTDFHYPLIQTLELVGTNKSGAPEVVAYQAMVADQVLVQIDLDQAPAGWREALAAEGYEVRRQITDNGLYTFAFEVTEADQVFRAIETLKNEKTWVAHAEADILIAARSNDPVPNDPGFELQWGFRNTGEFFGGTPGADIKAVDGWAVQMELQRQRQLARGVAEDDLELAPGAGYWLDAAGNRQDVVVAVLDTGINYRHLDLAANMWINPNETRDGSDTDGNGFIDDIHGVNLVLNNGDPMDYNGHGTHVAGTIGAIGNNDRGVAGVAWDVKLMAIQFLNDFGGGTLSDSILAIDYAWQNGAHVLNNSWGFDAYGAWISGLGPSASLSNAIQRSRNAGAIFVAAAGNDSSDNDIYPSYPNGHWIKSDNVVNVGSMEPSGARSVWARYRFIWPFPWQPDEFVDIGSNYGRESVHVFAPGSSIISTYVGGDNDNYALLDGTSMAAPHVAGMYAVLKAEYPNEPYEVLKARLLRRADSDARLAGYGQKGRRANLARALDPAPLIFEAPEENIELPFGESVTLTVKVSKSGITPGSRYAWYLNDDQIEGGPVPPADLRGVLTFQRPGAGTGLYRFEIESPFGKSVVMTQVRRPTEFVGGGSLGTALGESYLTWTTSGDQPWIVADSEDPEPGVRAGSIEDGMESVLSTTVTGPGTLTYEWRVSSEPNYDWGRFSINGQVQEQISSESGWFVREYTLPAGTHELRWDYRKDSSGAAGDDTLWLRNLSYVSDHPVILAQNISGTLEVARGENITIAFEAAGANTLEYWWTRKGEVLAGENTPNLVLTNLGDADTGTYVGTVRNSHGSVRTVPVTLQVVDAARAPEITQHPQSFHGYAGASMTLNADWVATFPDTAQWYRNGEPLVGQTGPALSLSNLQEADSGEYTIVVSNSAGTVASRVSQVTILPQPVAFSDYLESLPPSANQDEALLNFSLGLGSGEGDLSAMPKFVMAHDIQVGVTNDGAEISTLAGDAVYPALEFVIRTDITGVQYLLEVSDDLLTWLQVDSQIELLGEPEGNRQRVRLRQVDPVVEGEAKRFLRLRIEGES